MRYKRLLSLLLTFVLILLVPISSLAETLPAGKGDTVFWDPGDGTATGTQGVNPGWGIRVTFGSSAPFLEHGMTDLPSNPTDSDLTRQFDEAWSTAEDRYIEPGPFGLNFYTGFRPDMLVSSSTSLGYRNSKNKFIDMLGTSVVNDKLNKLAWNCYYTDPGVGTDRPDTDPTYSYNDTLFDLVFGSGALSGSGDPMSWLSNIKAQYYAVGNLESGTVKAKSGTYSKDTLRRVIVANGQTAGNNMKEFTWSSNADGSAQGNPSQKVRWSRIGYITALMQICWAAEEVGDIDTYEDMATKIAAWAQTGYTDSSLMPIILMEATTMVSFDGLAQTSTWCLMTLPFLLQLACGSATAERLYSIWPKAAKGNTDTAILNITNGLSVPAARQSQLCQGLGYYPLNGQKILKPGSWNGRNHFRNLRPMSGNDNLIGYIHNWTFFSDVPISEAVPDRVDADGSFTWKLNPNGIHDVTPDTEINASSTVYDINMSQSGYNKNNYDNWKARVHGDSSNANKIKVNVYRVSQPVPKDTKAGEFTRGQVKNSGKDVHTAVDRVVLGDGEIRNVPILGTLSAGIESRDLTDDELLDILKTATGMSYTESIAGPLDEGIRVTYAVYIDVKVGNSGWSSLDNNQAEFVEYRSVPGTYTFKSDSPGGYAELKCGYFDSSKYEEPFEAMAGMPTTENVYFASGGQEFVAELTYEYVTDQDAIRNFEQAYTTEKCDGWYSSGVYKEATTGLTQDEINKFMDWTTKIEGVNCKTCPTCGFQHFAGAGGDEVAYPTTYREGKSDWSFTVPGSGLWEVYDVKEVSWDWSVDPIEAHDIDGTGSPEIDPNTGLPTPPDRCDGATGPDVSDSSKQPADITCGHHTSSYHKTRCTRWTFKVGANHIDFNTGATARNDGGNATKLTSSIKFTQSYNDMNFAKIKNAHVWRLEKSRVAGVKQLTFEDTDEVFGDNEELAHVIYNAAQNNTASEGRMFYVLDPGDGDNYKFNQTLKTRGCCHCNNHNAAEDLIKSPSNPNNMFEEAWCISDYLVLDGSKSTTSLLYHQYSSQNAPGEIPILNIKVSDNPQDNSYTVLREDSAEEIRDWSKQGKVFGTQSISFNTKANAVNGTEASICRNNQTYIGGGVGSDDIDWCGYNGRYGQTDTTLASGTTNVSDVGKYRSHGGVNNFGGSSGKKIFMAGYQHRGDGEVNGYSTGTGSQRLERPNSPVPIVANGIEVDDVEVHNGRKSFKDPSIFYHNIISYGDTEPSWSEDVDPVYDMPGFHKSTQYSDRTEGINDIVIHNPVSTQDAKIIPLPSDLDQRVYDSIITDSLNQDNGKCPGTANACRYAHLNCQYNGERYHTDACYTKVRGQGLATIPIKGSQTTGTKPVTTTKVIKHTGNKEFYYTGGPQTFTAPGDGKYKLEVWGGRGGDGYDSRGGSGGYASGYITLKQGQSITFEVGGSGIRGGTSRTYGGGGTAGVSMEEDPRGGASGGGASSVIVSGNKVIIAPGGGGGSHLSNGKAGYNISNFVGDTQGYDAKTRHGGGGGGGAVGGSVFNAANACQSYGMGGSFYLSGVENPTHTADTNFGKGKAAISWEDATETITTTIYVPVNSGDYEYDTTKATVFPTTFQPQIYTAPVSGYYSIHLYGSAGGGEPQGKPSAAGKGGYAAGQIYLTSGEQVLITVGGQGSNGYEVTPAFSGGYNGGGRAINTAGGGFGGGGATDVSKVFTYNDPVRISTLCNRGILNGNSVLLTTPGAYYEGPRVPAKAGNIYRIDLAGDKLDKATLEVPDGRILHTYTSVDHLQAFFTVNNDTSDLRFKVNGNNAVQLSGVYLINLADRVLVAGGGGGADNRGGVLNGNDDGRGGNGGGLSGGNGYTNGTQHYQNAGGTASTGNALGYGGNGTSGDAGGGGGGYWGGLQGANGNSGGGGGSSYVGDTQYAITEAGQNADSGYAVVILPGMGDTEYTHMLSCNEPHHAPNSNWHRYTDGWRHEGGHLCTGVNCPYCAQGKKLYSPTGKEWDPGTLTANAYIICHDGKYHLTDGPDTWCDECNQEVTFDTYSLDGKTRQNCVWKATDYDAACFDTSTATNPAYHYGVGDETCYDACMDDNNHKLKNNIDATTGRPEKAGQFVLLDNDFQVYFPNIGDFYGNGGLGLGNTQKTEGWGYVDRMSTTPWLREKYVSFPFDVTYRGHTYTAGSKILLGSYDAADESWHDDSPDNYTYDFHCLLSNNEAMASEVQFVAIAKNTPLRDNTENKMENRNYTRYGSNIRAYHDASKNYFIDIVGRIGVLSILDTGDFRFSNYYKQPLDTWKVQEVVKDVDVSKQNFVSIDNKTIFGDEISTNTNGQNTWGLTNWMEPMDKLQSFPLTPGKNNVPALKNQAHRIGYSDYMSLVTVGNYYGENSKDDNNKYRVQIQPFYYHYNLDTKEWTPVDVYIKNGNKYSMINDYGTDQSTTDYNFYYSLDWESEKLRRMYTPQEEAASRKVQSNWYQLWDSDSEAEHIKLPSGINSLLGTANMLFLRDSARTFIGTRNRYGVDTETDAIIPEQNFNRQAQRWHFTLGLPSSAAFVKAGDPFTPEAAKKFSTDNGVILCALEIYAKGTVWTLKYDGTPASERSCYLFDGNTTLINWADAGTNGPEDKRVIAIYTNSKTSRNDILTEGSH